MKSEPFDKDPNLQVAFRSATSVAPIMMSNVCVTGRASVACAKNCETDCFTKDGLTNNSKTTIDITGLTLTIHDQYRTVTTYVSYEKEPSFSLGF